MAKSFWTVVDKIGSGNSTADAFRPDVNPNNNPISVVAYGDGPYVCFVQTTNAGAAALISNNPQLDRLVELDIRKNGQNRNIPDKVPDRALNAAERSQAETRILAAFGDTLPANIDTPQKLVDYMLNRVIPGNIKSEKELRGADYPVID